MENELNLAELGRNISDKLVDSKYLIDILEEIAEGEPKLQILINLLKQNIMSAFKEIEECRQKIYILD